MRPVRHCMTSEINCRINRLCNTAHTARVFRMELPAIEGRNTFPSHIGILDIRKFFAVTVVLQDPTWPNNHGRKGKTIKLNL